MKNPFKRWFGPREIAENIEDEQPTGYFSTHFDIAAKGKKSAIRFWDKYTTDILKTLPLPETQTGTAMDDSDSSVKRLSGLSQPNIPDMLMMWYASQGFIGYQMCAFLMQHWLIDKVCTMPARDAIRRGFEIVSADGSELQVETIQKIQRCNKAINLEKSLEQFIRMGKGFGIRILFFDIESDDPDFYEKPFNLDGVKQGSYKGIIQVDPYWTSPQLDTASAINPATREFYEPTWWMINGKKYHRSHLVIYRESEVPDILKPSYLYGGPSVPQRIMERVYAAERTANEGPLLAMTKRTTVFSTDLAQAMADKEKFDTRMLEWITMRDNQQVKIADKDSDTVQQFDTALSDLDSVIMTQYQLVAAACGVPATKLLGTSPKGFNATGDYEEASYHEELESLQTHALTPVVDRHHQILIKSHFNEELSVEIKWNPVDSPTAAEEADINTKKSGTLKSLVDSSAVDGYDVRDYLTRDKTLGFSFLEKVERPDEFGPSPEPELPPDDTPPTTDAQDLDWQ